MLEKVKYWQPLKGALKKQLFYKNTGPQYNHSASAVKKYHRRGPFLVKFQAYSLQLRDRLQISLLILNEINLLTSILPEIKRKPKVLGEYDF